MPVHLLTLPQNTEEFDPIARILDKPLFCAAKLRRIAIFGHFGNENLGDEATIVALMANLRRRVPHAELVGFSLRPADTAWRHGVIAYPIRRMSPAAPFQKEQPADNVNLNGDEPRTPAPTRIDRLRQFVKRFPLVWRPARAVVQFLRTLMTGVQEVGFLFKAFARLRKIDLLIIAGSNQFLDNFGGPWGFPYTLLKWTLLAKCARTEVIFLNVGAGPIDGSLSKFALRIAARLARYVSVRDQQSRQLLKTLGISDQAAVFPDLAFSLQNGYIGQRGADFRFRNAPPVVGINPMPVYDDRYWCVADPVKYAQYVDDICRFAMLLLQDGCTVVFWSTQPRDQNVIVDVLARLRPQISNTFDNQLRTAQPASVDDLMGVISSFDIAVATRFHGVVLSLLLDRPVLAICYHPKMQDLMDEFGQAEYAVNFDDLDPKALYRRFVELSQKQSFAASVIRQRRNEFCKKLNSQYDSLFGRVATADGMLQGTH